MPEAHGRDRIAPAAGGLWTISSPFPKGWRARRAGTRVAPEHPGTAVDWDGTLYEVVSMQPAGAGVRYTLARWEDRHTIRVHEPYDDATEERRSRERADEGNRRRKRRLLLLLSPLAGHLPAEVQERWEREDDAPASLLTLISALPLFVFGFLCSFSLAIRGFTGVVLLPFSEKVLFLGVYLFVESGFRLSVAWSQERPAGSLAGHLAWEIARRVRPELAVPESSASSPPRA
jgi:hypothetical protein